MVNQYSMEYNKAIEIPSPPSAVSLAGDSREPMANHYSSEDNQAIEIPSPPSAVSLAGGQPRTDGKPIFLRRITRPSRSQVHPRPCLWQGDSREPMVNQYSMEDSKAIKIPSPPSAVSLGGDSREPMANHYSSEDNQAIKTPSPPSAVSLAGDSREPMVNQYSSEDNQAIETSKSSLGRVSGRGQPRTDGKPIFYGV